MFQKIELTPSEGATTRMLWLNSPAKMLEPLRSGDLRERLHDWAQTIDFAPDLGRDIGSRTWWRGLITCLSLCGTMVMSAPGVLTVPGPQPAPLTTHQMDQYRSQMISASALGADTGQRMGPTDMVAPLKETPERPQIELDAAIGRGDSFAHMLTRSGVSSKDANEALSLIRGAVDPATISPGTRVHMVLGRRANRNTARPLDHLAVRARLELALEVTRENGALTLKRIPIAVDNTPLRIRGKVGDSLYRSARAAGAEPSTIQAYLKVIATQTNVGGVRANDEFDIIVAHRRAATGENETGELLYAGLQRAGAKRIDMLRWTQGGRSEWFEASGAGERRGTLARPVAGGRQSSGYGMRKHPILGYKRMHAGMDFAAPSGTPIYAAADGRVVFSGWSGGHGKFVKIQHSGGLGSGYAHMSRIAVAAGKQVKRGQVIGYVGSTGLSTGPHLHYELYRNGRTINPASVKFTEVAQLSGSALTAFRNRLAELKRLPAGLPQPAREEGSTQIASIAGLATPGAAPASAGGGAPNAR